MSVSGSEGDNGSAVAGDCGKYLWCQQGGRQGKHTGLCWLLFTLPPVLLSFLLPFLTSALPSCTYTSPFPLFSLSPRCPPSVSPSPLTQLFPTGLPTFFTLTLALSSQKSYLHLSLSLNSASPSLPSIP